jgi:hypothetical protein
VSRKGVACLPIVFQIGKAVPQVNAMLFKEGVYLHSSFVPK